MATSRIFSRWPLWHSIPERAATPKPMKEEATSVEPCLQDFNQGTGNVTFAALGITSLPTEIIIQILSYLPYMDRFRLKMSGSRMLYSIVSGLPKPSLEAYLQNFNWARNSGTFICPLPGCSDPIVCFRRHYSNDNLENACVVGHNALVLKLIKNFMLTISIAPSLAAAHRQRLVKERDAAIIEYLSRCIKWATMGSQLSTMQLLIENGAQVSQEQGSSYTACGEYNSLQLAALNNDESITRLLLKHGAKVNFDARGYSAIDIAARMGHEGIIRILLTRVFWNRGRKLSSALAEAAENGHRSIVQLLLEKGAKVHGVPSHPSALHLAVKAGHESIVRLLLQHGAVDVYVIFQNYHSPSTRSARNWSCLHFAAFEGNHQMVKFLLHERIMPNDQKNFRDTVLPLAVLRGNLETVKVLLENGMSIDGEILGGENAIHIATVEGNTEMMALLLDHGANPNSRDRDENTPLHKARSGPVISLLLERAADKNALNYAGETPIHRLVDRGNRVALEVLLEARPKIDIANRAGQTATKCAIETDKLDCLTALLVHGASIECRSSRGFTDLHHAVYFSRHEHISLLLDHGANLEAEDTQGIRPLHLAAGLGHEDCVKTLLVAGADRTARTHEGETFLHWAARGPKMLSKLIHWMPLINEKPLLSELNAINDQGQTPLHITALNHNILAYNLLMTNGADYSLKDHSGRTAWELHQTRMDEIKHDLLAG